MIHGWDISSFCSRCFTTSKLEEKDKKSVFSTIAQHLLGVRPANQASEFALKIEQLTGA